MHFHTYVHYMQIDKHIHTNKQTRGYLFDVIIKVQDKQLMTSDDGKKIAHRDTSILYDCT